MLAAMECEFADAEVAACTLQEGMLTVRFSAVRVHDRASSTAHDAVQWIPLQLVAQGAEPALDHDATATPWGRVHDGLVRWAEDGARQRGFPVPWHSDCPATLELEWAQGGQSSWTVRSLQLQALPGQCAVGAYQC